MRTTTSGLLTVLLSGILLLASATAAPAGSPGPGQETVGPAAAAAAGGTTISLAPGLSGFDNIGADSSNTLACLSAAGYSFDVIDALGTGWDTEYRAAAALGMSVVLFQGYYQPLWSDPAQGTTRGALMAANAASVGYPKGAQVYLNLENNLTDGTNPVTRSTMIQWVQNWAAAVTTAGYSPGVYVGVPQLLTAGDLDSALPTVAAFWRSASGSAPQTGRGYALRQPSIAVAACGTTIDVDTSGSAAGGTQLVGAGFPRAAGSPTTAGAYGPLTPSRILDTRSSAPVSGLTGRSVQVLGLGGVPASGVGAVVVNMTVTDTTAEGFLTVYPTGAARPNASNVNFRAGQTVPNLVVVPVGSDGTVQVYNGSGAAVDVVVDVAGYYRGGTPSAAGTLTALTPSRILDTRSTAPVSGLTGRSVQVLGLGGVPASGVGAVVVNMTVTDTTAEGFLTVYPTGAARPNASNLNFRAGQTVPNLVVVPVGSDGTIQVYNGSGAAVDVVVDVAGYYRGGTPSAAGTLTALTPSRILDTRSSAVVPGLNAIALTVAGRGGVPATGASAAIVNLTVTDTTAEGFVTAFPTGVNRPDASNLNFRAGQTVPNLVVVPLGLDGKIVLYNGSGAAVDLVADVVGYISGG